MGKDTWREDQNITLYFHRDRCSKTLGKIFPPSHSVKGGRRVYCDAENPLILLILTLVSTPAIGDKDLDRARPIIDTKI